MLQKRRVGRMVQWRSGPLLGCRVIVESSGGRSSVANVPIEWKFPEGTVLVQTLSLPRNRKDAGGGGRRLRQTADEAERRLGRLLLYMERCGRCDARVAGGCGASAAITVGTPRERRTSEVEGADSGGMYVVSQSAG